MDYANGIWWDCSSFFINDKGEVIWCTGPVLDWLKASQHLYLLLIILFVGIIIFCRKKNGNGIIPKPQKENIWRWVKWLRYKLNLNGEK